MFDKEDVAKMEKFDGRREKASFFLGLCKGLPKRKLENVVQHLKEIVSSSKPILNGAELGKCIKIQLYLLPSVEISNNNNYNV